MNCCVLLLVISLSCQKAISIESNTHVQTKNVRRLRRRQQVSQEQRRLSDVWIQQQRNLHQRKSATLTRTELENCPCDDISWCKPIRSSSPIRSGGEIYGFINDGGGSTTLSLDYFNWTHVSTVAWASNDRTMCDAHAHNARAVLAAPSINLTEFALEPVKQQIWVEAVLDMVQIRHRDGIVFDYEQPLTRHSPEAFAYVDLVALTAMTFRKHGLQTVVCVAWSPDGIDGRDYPWMDLADAADALYVMNYDTRSEIFDACIASANAPFPGMIRGIERFLALGIAPAKLILGVPWYGYRYECLPGTAPDARFCPIGLHPWRSVNCSDAVGHEIAFAKLQGILQRRQARGTKSWNETGGLRRDEYMDAPYFNAVEQTMIPQQGENIESAVASVSRRVIGDDGGGRHEGLVNENDMVVAQYWFDDAASLRRKFAWAAQAGFVGVGPYSFEDLDPSRDPSGEEIHASLAEMWSSLDAFFPE